ncbi:hypothetical protein [Pseudomonas sp. MRSN 12121]|uniref:hypothetical protein n=1 Tax=Pseudomonas sp. MRSN 12121 TaxID=1611770 RepID=UPI000AD5FC58|nr:hypothetical protein [Pseudomonas sp. MRSN 12121]
MARLALASPRIPLVDPADSPPPCVLRNGCDRAWPAPDARRLSPRALRWLIRRAIDPQEGERIDEAALQALNLSR